MWNCPPWRWHLKWGVSGWLRLCVCLYMSVCKDWGCTEWGWRCVCVCVCERGRLYTQMLNNSSHRGSPWVLENMYVCVSLSSWDFVNDSIHLLWIFCSVTKWRRPSQISHHMLPEPKHTFHSALLWFWRIMIIRIMTSNYLTVSNTVKQWDIRHRMRCSWQ